MATEPTPAWHYWVGPGCEAAGVALAAAGGVGVVDEAEADDVWGGSGDGGGGGGTVTVASARAQTLLSWKGSLAALQRAASDTPGDRLPGSLATVVLDGVRAVESWCRRRWRLGGDGGAAPMWVLKDSHANGGNALWVVSAANWRSVVEQARALYRGAAIEPEFVMQE